MTPAGAALRDGAVALTRDGRLGRVYAVRETPGTWRLETAHRVEPATYSAAAVMVVPPDRLDAVRARLAGLDDSAEAARRATPDGARDPLLLAAEGRAGWGRPTVDVLAGGVLARWLWEGVVRGLGWRGLFRAARRAALVDVDELPPRRPWRRPGRPA